MPPPGPDTPGAHVLHHCQPQSLLLTGGPGGPPSDICCMPAAACGGPYPGAPKLGGPPGAVPGIPPGPGGPGGRIMPPLGGPLAIGAAPGGCMPYWPGGGPAKSVAHSSS